MKKIITNMIIFSIIISISVSSVSAQQIEPLPLTNEDLSRIIAYAKSVQYEASQCSGECVDLTCKPDNDVINELYSIQEVLEIIKESGAAYSKPILKHWQSISDEMHITKQQQSRAEQALIIQNALLTYGEVMLKIASLYEFGTETLEKMAKGELLSSDTAVLKFIEDVNKALVKLEDLIAIVSPQYQKIIPDEVRKIVKIKKDLEYIKKAITLKFKPKDAYKIFANRLKDVAKADKAKRESWIQELRKTYSAEEQIFESAYEYYRLLQVRRNLALDALAEVNKALDMISNCVSKHCEALPFGRETFKRFESPAEELYFYNKWLDSHSLSFMELARSLYITNVCPDARCKILPFYLERFNFVKNANFEKTNLPLRFARVNALNQEIELFELSEGIVIAPSSNLLKQQYAAILSGKRETMLQCPFWWQHNIMNKISAEARIKTVITGAEAELQATKDKRRAAELEVKLKQWKEDLKTVQETPKLFSTRITSPLLASQVAEVMEKTILSLRREAEKWEEE